MTVVAIGSVHGSPGVTSLALDLARLFGPDTLLIEADPDGGCLAARLDLAVRPGITELAGAARTGIGADDLWRYAQPAAGIAVIVAHPSAEQVQAALRVGVQHVGRALASMDRDVVVDVGRLRPGSPALGLAGLADLTIVVMTNSVDAVVAVHHRRQLLGGLTPVQLVVTSAAPHGLAEISHVAGHPVWGEMPPPGRRRAMRRRHGALLRLVADLRPDAPSAEPAKVPPATVDRVVFAPPAAARPTMSVGSTSETRS